MPLIKKKLGGVIICPFDQYLKQKEQWFKDHPTATIDKQDQFRSISVQNINLAASGIHIPGAPETQQVIMVIWAFVFEELVEETALIN